MAGPSPLLTLPPELRERIYEYIALSHTTRRVRTIHNSSNNAPVYKTSTSAISATCHLIHQEYEAVARRCTTVLECATINMDFDPIMAYFRDKVDSHFLTILKQNKAEILVNILITDPQHYHRNIANFYPWALFLISTHLEAIYQSDVETWMEIHIARPPTEFEEQCVIDNDTPQEIRDNIENIRKLAGDFDRDVWKAYPAFFKKMQVRYREEWDRREARERET
ncbi:hypothetical protein Slin15195_G050070 [Septoria linicola]|uniref:F-box domain-containing protein n=1 Tax=Septoria linicola TaxID=215465 RepID=A0A9Q9AT67_9PEZI|nr:hypothetical protein Slin15195_G050070 [Septoria linicola]